MSNVKSAQKTAKKDINTTKDDVEFLKSEIKTVKKQLERQWSERIGVEPDGRNLMEQFKTPNKNAVTFETDAKPSPIDTKRPAVAIADGSPKKPPAVAIADGSPKKRAASDTTIAAAPSAKKAKLSSAESMPVVTSFPTAVKDKKQSATAITMVVDAKQAEKAKGLASKLQNAYEIIQDASQELTCEVVDTQIKSTYKCWIKFGSKDGAAAIKDYIQASGDINRALCDGTITDKPKFQAQRDLMVSYLGLLPSYTGWVYRGMGETTDKPDDYWPKMIKEILTSNIYEEKGFSSTSLLSFEQQSNGKGSSNQFALRLCLMKIRSKTGRNIQGFSTGKGPVKPGEGKWGEFEVLFAPGTRFKVLDYKPRPGRQGDREYIQHIFEMEEMD
ncbi:MAG: hypothetical protein SGARI_003269 [Bacillariaceae sp.]